MIRDFRATDGPRLYVLLQRHFPAEEALYGTRPDGYARVVRRVYRWDVRLLLGLLALFRHPIFRFFVLEVDGQLAATTLLSFTERAGYLSTVVVDTPYRGRGYARQLLRASHEASYRAGRRYAVLDVLSDNAPARALYASEGYHPLSSSSFYSLALGPPPPSSASAPPPPFVVRPLRRSDRAPLLETLRRSIPPAVAEVLPPRRGQLAGTPTIDSLLSSRSESWVLAGPDGPVAWARASSSEAMEAASLTCPIIDPGADAVAVAALLAGALGWCRAQGAVRVISQIPEYQRLSIVAVEAQGLRPAQKIETMCRPLTRS